MRRAEAIILAKRTFGEADELVTVLTKGQGKALFVARGVKKASAKHKGALAELNWLEIYYVVGRGLPIITDTVVKESFPQLKGNLLKLRAGQLISRLLERSLPLGDPASTRSPRSGEAGLGEAGEADRLVWPVFVEHLFFLEQCGKESSTELLPAIFTYKMLNLQGFSPELERCVICHREAKLNANLSFSASAGGVIHNSCVGAEPTALAFGSDEHALLLDWHNLSVAEILGKSISYQKHGTLCRIIERFASWHLGFPVELGLSKEPILRYS